MKIIIIGAGAAGLCAAIEAAKNKHEVTVLELKEACGKKLLATGNGRCNLTNKAMDISCYHGDNMEFINNVITKYDTAKIEAYFNDLGVLLCHINGYVYPYSKQSHTIVNALYNTACNLGVSFIFNCNVKDINKISNSEGFVVSGNVTENKTSTRYEYKCDKVIVCAGGRANKVLGSDGSGYYLLSKLGHKVNTVLPSLVPLVCKESIKGELKKLKGVRCNGHLTLYDKDIKVDESTGEIQFTDYGLSGIVTFQISGMANKLLNEKKKIFVQIDFLPDYDIASIKSRLRGYIKQLSSKCTITYKSIFSNIVNDKLACVVLNRIDINENEALSKDYEEILDKGISLLKEYSLEIVGSKDFDNAQVCLGGISLNEIKDTMESKLVCGLYITGEVLDVDGICGGYNLHFAFASGIIAGRSVWND